MAVPCQARLYSVRRRTTALVLIAGENVEIYCITLIFVIGCQVCRKLISFLEVHVDYRGCRLVGYCYMRDSERQCVNRYP